MDDWMDVQYIRPPIIHVSGASLLTWSSNTFFCWLVTNETSAGMKEKSPTVPSDQRVLYRLWSSCSSSRQQITGSSLPPQCLHVCPGNQAPGCRGWCQRCVGWIPEILKPETSCRSCWKKSQSHQKIKFLFPEPRRNLRLHKWSQENQKRSQTNRT